MAIRLTNDDYELFSSVAEYRVLTVSQLRLLLRRNLRALRRRLTALCGAGHVHLNQTGFGRRGRPETLVSLAKPGVELLRRRETLAADVADARVTAEDFKPLHHQLLVNWFRIHLINAECMSPRFAVRFRAPTSPFLERGLGGRALPVDHIRLEDPKGRHVGFTPDGVFSVTDSEQSKALLFFLEADRGTENVASATRSQRDIRQKIVNYQTYFRSGGYKRYEATWGCEFNGFRLLVLVNSRSRHAAICRLTRDMPPSDFVWLGEQEKMFELGVFGDMWARGGHIDRPPQSILGKLSFPSQIPINECSHKGAVPERSSGDL